MQKTFKVAQVRDLLNQVHNEKISFSRFVEILNELAEGQRKFKIDKLEGDWLRQVNEGLGFFEVSTGKALKDLGNKMNEIVDVLNNKNSI